MVSPGAPVRPVKPGAKTTPGLPVFPVPTGTPVITGHTGQKALEAQDTQFLDRSEPIVQNSPVRPVQLEHNDQEYSDLLNSDSLDDKADESPERAILRHARHQSPAIGHSVTGQTGHIGTGHIGTGHIGTGHTGSTGHTYLLMLPHIILVLLVVCNVGICVFCPFSFVLFRVSFLLLWRHYRQLTTI